ncbi:MAG: RIP metalloprotease RseP [Clostridia bacterium]|nr:RIP metalloprotease RseP [Clostridia bacterium]
MITILGWLFNLLKIIAILGTLVTIHELGHFIVAKLCNVKVHKFSIGFGPKLFKRDSGETEYTLRLIPFGGFVQMEGEEERSDDERAFNKKPIRQRIAIVSAGAIVNIIFAIIVYFALASVNNSYYSTQITGLDEGPLYEAGLRSGDIILSVNGKKVLMQGDVESIIENSKEDSLVFEYERSGEVFEKQIEIPIQEMGFLGVAFYESGEVMYLVTGSPAEKMDLKIGDVAYAVNGIEANNSDEIVNEIRKVISGDITISVMRSGESLELPGKTESTIGRVYTLMCNTVQPGFWKGLKYAWGSTWFYLRETVIGTAEIFLGKAQNVEVMGPVGIAEKISETSAWFEFFNLMSAISLSLGIFNLLPIPALDGGRILILVIEGIRRKPMKESIEQGLILAGFGAIILLALVITIMDLIKLF